MDFFIYFKTFSAPTADTLFLLVLSILALACSHVKADYSWFMNITASMAFRLVPDSLRTQPVFLCIDDTIESKSGTKFEDVSVLFDLPLARTGRKDKPVVHG